MEQWLTTESMHYLFHYKNNSYAHKNISKIVEEQEQRFDEIIRYFPAEVRRKTAYWLCDTREEVARLADDVPTNGIFCWNDDDTDDVSIYVVYNETVQCTGYHEETHAITHFVNEPSSSALGEGVAVFMEKTWWGVEISLYTKRLCMEDKYVSVKKLICDKEEDGQEFFWSVKEEISYPIMGAFVGFLLSKEETNPGAFLRLYQYEGDSWEEEFEKVYNCSLAELEEEFLTELK